MSGALRHRPLWIGLTGTADDRNAGAVQQPQHTEQVQNAGPGSVPGVVFGDAGSPWAVVDLHDGNVTANSPYQRRDETVAVVEPGQFEEGFPGKQLQAAAGIGHAIMKQRIPHAVRKAGLEAFPGGVLAILAIAGNTEIRVAQGVGFSGAWRGCRPDRSGHRHPW